ncbi:MAG: SH3 domain-containing protein [Firmicutes bacterium]|nr:SH3 domain-containing protein [Bacillota bacterium]
MKKSFSIGLAFALCTASSAYAATKGKINADDVNIRTQASTSSDVIKRLSSGVTVTVTESKDGWYKLATASGGVAYVKDEFVTLTQADAVVEEEFINVRESDDITSAVIGVVSKGQTITVTGVEGDWYTVTYNSQKGYVYNDDLTGGLVDFLNGATAKAAPKAAEPAIAAADVETDNGVYVFINSTSLNLREEANTDSEIIDCYPNGYTFEIVGIADGGWVKVMDDSERVGYVKAEFVDFKNGAKPDNTVYDNSRAKRVDYSNEAPATVKADEMISYAKQFIGTPYVYGGTSLTSGVDCSGFIYSVYGDFGITLDRRSRDQINDGPRVAKEDLRPGDLVFFNTGGESEISHVGMYIGNGEYIHSTNGAANGVTISDINSDYALNTYVGAARILDEN